MNRFLSARNLTSNVKKSWKTIAIVSGVFVLLQAVFFGLLVAGQAVPDRAVIDQLAADVDEGFYGPSGISDHMGGSADTFTECVVVGTGLGMEGKNLLERAAFMPRISNCAEGKQQILDLAAGKPLKSTAVTGYYKYWAGYTVLTRPVIALAGIEGIRIISGGLLLISISLATIMVSRTTNVLAALGLIFPLSFASNIMSTPSTSFSQAISIAAMFFGVALTAWGVNKSEKHGLALLALSASVFCYVDLLTTPAIPWTLSVAVLATAKYLSSGRVSSALKLGLVGAVVWIASFGLTWAARWIIAGIVLGFQKTYKFILSNVEFRTGGEYEGVSKALFASTNANWSYWLGQISTAGLVLVIGGLVTVIALAFGVLRRGPKTLAYWLALSSPAVIIVLWYEAVGNHSQIHQFFTYRGFPTLLGVLLFVALALASMVKKGIAGSASVATEEGATNPVTTSSTGGKHALGEKQPK